jgi:hypothetical protein
MEVWKILIRNLSPFEPKTATSAYPAVNKQEPDHGKADGVIDNPLLHFQGNYPNKNINQNNAKKEQLKAGFHSEHP